MSHKKGRKFFSSTNIEDKNISPIKSNSSVRI